MWKCIPLYLFFFQAEDGIRDLTVTGVQTCALPICAAILVVEHAHAPPLASRGRAKLAVVLDAALLGEQAPPVARDHQPGRHVMQREHLEQADAVGRARGSRDGEDDRELVHQRPRRFGAALPPVTTTMTRSGSSALAGGNARVTPAAVSTSGTAPLPRS